METLGIRNNNPMNIRYNPLNRWLGLKGFNNGFCVFNNIDYGLRAGIITLRTYITKHGLTSVEKIIERFAPVSENNTGVYISYVSTFLSNRGFDPNNIKYDSDAFKFLVQAICKYESIYTLTRDHYYYIINTFKL